jgi:TPR repeat protein
VDLFIEGKYTEALAAWEKAVEEGNGRAATLIGDNIYRTGIGEIQPDAVKMATYYQKAADLKDTRGIACLADVYRRGEGGITQDLSKAYALLKSVENVEDDVISDIAAAFYSVGAGTPVDYSKARLLASKIKDEGMKQNRLQDIDRREARSAVSKSEASKLIPAKNLITEVDQNQMRFDKNYKEKIITIEGFVDDIEEKKGTYVLKIYGERDALRNPFKFIECHFEKKHEDALLDLNKGDTVRVRGTYKGKQQFQLGSLVLFDCEIVK